MNETDVYRTNYPNIINYPKIPHVAPPQITSNITLSSEQCSKIVGEIVSN